jgi:hypothetical protein
MVRGLRAHRTSILQTQESKPIKAQLTRQLNNLNSGTIPGQGSHPLNSKLDAPLIDLDFDSVPAQESQQLRPFSSVS